MIYNCFLLIHSAVEVDREKGFHLDVEDYLAGVLIMASELVRVHAFFMSCVIVMHF